MLVQKTKEELAQLICEKCNSSYLSSQDALDKILEELDPSKILMDCKRNELLEVIKRFKSERKHLEDHANKFHGILYGHDILGSPVDGDVLDLTGFLSGKLPWNPGVPLEAQKDITNIQNPIRYLNAEEELKSILNIELESPYYSAWTHEPGRVICKPEIKTLKAGWAVEVVPDVRTTSVAEFLELFNILKSMEHLGIKAEEEVKNLQATVANAIAFDIIGVQPLEAPKGLVFALKSRYNI